MHASVSPEQSELLHRELEPGERLIWTGCPSEKRLAKQANVATILMSIYGVMLGFMAVAMSFGRSGLGPGLMMGLVSMGLIVGAILTAVAQGKRASKIAYGITDRRVIIVHGSAKQIRVESIHPQNLPEIVRIEQPDGSGDLMLGTRLMTQAGNGQMQMGHSQPLLLGIPDVKRVERLIRETFYGSKPVVRTAAELAAESELDAHQWWTRNRGS